MAKTIRRDLSDLADAGHLDRVHGGALLKTGVANIGYEAGRRMNEAAKTAIGRSCAALIPDNCSLILNLGTTTEAVARELLAHRRITVITNTMNVANTWSAIPVARSWGPGAPCGAAVAGRRAGGQVG